MLIIAFCQPWVTGLSPILTLFLKIYLYSIQVLKVLISRNFLSTFPRRQWLNKELNSLNKSHDIHWSNRTNNKIYDLLGCLWLYLKQVVTILLLLVMSELLLHLLRFSTGILLTDIFHSLDVWHKAKSIRNCVNKATNVAY